MFVIVLQDRGKLFHCLLEVDWCMIGHAFEIHYHM